MPVWAFIKVLSLGYLLGAVCLSLGVLCWRMVRPRIEPAFRADIAFWGFSLCFAICLALTAALWAGVVGHAIEMSTPYFHRLMYGGWGGTIAASGLLVMLASLWISWRAWLSAKAVPVGLRQIGSVNGLPLQECDSVAAASLSGVLRPVVLVNPAYWARLGPDYRELSLLHEITHYHRRDNLRKLVLQASTAFYSALPWVRDIPPAHELACEFAVDAACAKRAGAACYSGLLRQSLAATQLGNGKQPGMQVLGGIVELRLAALQAGRESSTLSTSVLTGACLLLMCASCALPAILLLSHPTLRCLVACYLGY